MKKSIWFCLLAIGLVLTTACGKDNPGPIVPTGGITGTWTIAFSNWPGASFTAHIVQSGSTFTGTGGSSGGGGGSFAGSVAGNKVSGTIVQSSQVCSGTRQFSFVAILNDAGTTMTSLTSVQGFNCNGEDWESSDFGTLTFTRQALR